MLQRRWMMAEEACAQLQLGHPMVGLSGGDGPDTASTVMKAELVTARDGVALVKQTRSRLTAKTQKIAGKVLAFVRNRVPAVAPMQLQAAA